MLCNMPNPAITETKLLPPELKKGNGKPVTGSKPTFTPALTKTCEKINTAIPIENNLPKLETAEAPINRTRNTKNTVRPRTITAPINPNCSVRAANIKLFLLCITRFCRSLQSP